MPSRAEAADESPCSATAMRKATRRMTQLYDDALASAGLRSTQYAILEELHRQADAPPTMGDLAETLVLDRSALGHNLRPLERDGLVALVAGDNDRRRRRVVLTTTGRARSTGAPVSAGGSAAGADTGAFIDINSLLRQFTVTPSRAPLRTHQDRRKTNLRKGLSPLATTISTPGGAPVIAGMRLRAGKTNSGKGAGRMSPAIATAAPPASAAIFWCAVIRPTATARSWAPADATMPSSHL